MKKLAEFFEDSSNKYSMMRLITLILVIGGLTFGFMYPENYLFGAECILLGLGGKGTQKYVEMAHSCK